MAEVQRWRLTCGVTGQDAMCSVTKTHTTSKGLPACRVNLQTHKNLKEASHPEYKPLRWILHNTTYSGCGAYYAQRGPKAHPVGKHTLEVCAPARILKQQLPTTGTPRPPQPHKVLLRLRNNQKQPCLLM
jgi:hypothetical protein